MAFVKIYVHLVWNTKNKAKVLDKKFRPLLFEHIKENAKKKEIYILEVNGHLEHVHCLIGLSAEQSIAKVAMLLKGESAFWANKNSMLSAKLEWADEYYAGSVSEEILPRTRAYIQNQEEHHTKKTFIEEYDDFITEYGKGQG